ncbi:hypothetical protein ASZ78_001307 [Callipepla squamata]|uniref:Uncharacterized protein n=1 Tax=Callipepla squamata TaxID=9009 RepID=A0A226MF18_CALSU|nr:hypothetical protein ASZ78_001307 [Callipepla squamata]
MPAIRLLPGQHQLGAWDILSFLSCRFYMLRARLHPGVMLLAPAPLYTAHLGAVPKRRANVKGKQKNVVLEKIDLKRNVGQASVQPRASSHCSPTPCLLTTLVPPHPRAGSGPQDLGPSQRTLATRVQQDRTQGDRDHITDLQDHITDPIMDLITDPTTDLQDHTPEGRLHHRTLEDRLHRMLKLQLLHW